ncbi:MAG: hypothetical protein NTW67_03040 [Candidatus Woesearchaeota archaeon]|nr:hypothetical protein [Candidatus Woesearchaeota archaeon]
MATVVGETEQIVLDKPFVGGRDYQTIDGRVTAALRAGKPVRIDLTKAKNGVQSEFYFGLWNAVIHTFSEEQQIPKARELVRLVFENSASSAYVRYRSLFDGFFDTEFQNSYA